MVTEPPPFSSRPAWSAPLFRVFSPSSSTVTSELVPTDMAALPLPLASMLTPFSVMVVSVTFSPTVMVWPVGPASDWLMVTLLSSSVNSFLDDSSWPITTPLLPVLSMITSPLEMSYSTASAGKTIPAHSAKDRPTDKTLRNFFIFVSFLCDLVRMQRIRQPDCHSAPPGFPGFAHRRSRFTPPPSAAPPAGERQGVIALFIGSLLSMRFPPQGSPAGQGGTPLPIPFLPSRPVGRDTSSHLHHSKNFGIGQ